MRQSEIERVIPSRWWIVFALLVVLDVVLVVTDAMLGRTFPSGLQAWMLVQALLAILGFAALAASSKDQGYVIGGSLFAAIVVEDWLQVFSSTRLRLRLALHDLLPVLGRAPDRLSDPDPVDLVLAFVAAGVVILALWRTRPENRVHVRWLTGFLALGFVFAVLLDLYVDYNYSRMGAFIEETGETISVSGILAYLIGVVSTGLGRSAGASGRG